MIVSELILELQQYPLDLEVYIEGETPRDKPVTSADWNTNGQISWITISDFPIEEKDERTS